MFSLQILQEMSMLNMMVMSYHTYVVVCSKCCTVFVFFVKKENLAVERWQEGVDRRHVTRKQTGGSRKERKGRERS